MFEMAGLDLPKYLGDLKSTESPKKAEQQDKK
jgi:hypothetical protein